MRVSCVSIRCASSLQHIRWSAIYPLAYHLGMSLVPPPVTLLNKSVGTRSGVAPGAPVGVLASWDVGAPRAECAVYSEKRGTSSQFRSESQSDWHIFARHGVAVYQDCLLPRGGTRSSDLWAEQEKAKSVPPIGRLSTFLFRIGRL